MTRASLPTKFVRTKEVATAMVCRDVKSKPPKMNNPVPDSSKYQYHKIVLRVPDEYAFALENMFEGKGLQYAIMQLIKKHVKPMKIE